MRDVYPEQQTMVEHPPQVSRFPPPPPPQQEIPQVQQEKPVSFPQDLKFPLRKIEPEPKSEIPATKLERNPPKLVSQEDSGSDMDASSSQSAMSVQSSKPKHQEKRSK